MNIGTKIGAMIAHFADALPMNRLIIPETIISPIIKPIPVMPVFSRNSAPLTANTVARLLCEN